MMHLILSFLFHLSYTAHWVFRLETKKACPTAGKLFIYQELPYGGINHIRFKGWMKILSAYCTPSHGSDIQLTNAFYHNPQRLERKF